MGALGILLFATRVVIAPVTGPSNFHRLGIPFESSAMGRTGVWGPAPDQYAGPPGNVVDPERIGPRTALSGADIYRLSCRGCHRADGNGVPPEIPTIAGPVQATSATLMQSRMAERGRPITATFARELASGSKKDLLTRLEKGGQKMPSFGYLNEREVAALISYLEILAAVPGAKQKPPVIEPAAREGELLIRGTCHICHDATGPQPNEEQILQGAIPPIASLTARKGSAAFIWKVIHGAPITMGPLGLRYRGRMPVFDYLSENDVASAYLYLLRYPP